MASRGTTKISFWNVNVPSSRHTADCPDFLEYALENEKDRGILATPDAQYHRQTWQEVRQFILDNRLDLFQRVPSDLRRYREYNAKLTREYGSVMQFVMQERLGWEDQEAKAAPFKDPGDIKILYNDWPYGFAERIIHLVIWTKFDLVSDPATDDLTPQARREIDDFVDETIVRKCGEENVIWFKNWSSLKSIHAVEHFHVMLFEPDMEFVKQITGGDVPLAEKIKSDGEASS
ncbi:hypothetical protein LTR36_006103 [Oleoguttula mirabilis]|uniref:N-acetylglucosamine-induced protein 1 n=1 Tax=Oleoguttula mirabilis TaxID=1507867 RepID=A0AAV9JCG4_9PEZI|nr:hypothetical protein LTR36_006103 [Oleoguttula mirabilis]